MRVALYVRVSTQRQAQAQTIEHQLTRLQLYVQTQGWVVTDAHIFRDDGFSGASLSRPGLDRLRDAVAHGAYERIVLTAPDRLARKYVHQMLLIEECERAGCVIEFLDRPMSADPHDQLVLQIRGAVAEYERSLIADRMRRGRTARYKAGTLLPWTRPPFGYHVDPDHPRDPAGVRVAATEAPIVTEMFAAFADERHTLFSLAQHLMAQGIRTPQDKVRWNVASIRGILTNPVYTGVVYAGRLRPRPAKTRRSATHPIGTPSPSHTTTAQEEWICVAHIPPLVSQEVFDRVRARLQQNVQFAARHNTTHAYLLRSLVSCGVCKNACFARANGPYGYYVCRAKMNPITAGSDAKCAARYIPAEQLETVVWDDICAVLTQPQLVRTALERATNGEWLPQEAQARRTLIQKGRTGLAQQLDRLTTAYLDGIVLLEEYRRRRKDIEDREYILAAQEQQLQAAVDRHIDVAQVCANMTAFCQRVSAGLADATFAEKRQLIELLIDRVIVTNGDVEVRYVVPLSARSEAIRFCHLRKDYFDLPACAVQGTDVVSRHERRRRSRGVERPVR